MAELANQDVVSAFREILSEIRGVNQGFQNVLERTARLEVKVDGMLETQKSMARLEGRITQLESQAGHEKDSALQRLQYRTAIWLGLTGLLGAVLGGAVSHFWK